VRLGRKLRIDRAPPRDARVAALRLGNPIGGGKLERYRPSTAQASSAALMDLVSTITCPRCGRQSAETMPTNACQFFYECTHCSALLKPKAGDCCVFCSYGDVPCPSIQQTKELGQAIGCCSRESSYPLAAIISYKEVEAASGGLSHKPHSRTFCMRVGILLALLSATLFGMSMPLAKILMGSVSPWLMAGLLYFGAGLGLAAVHVPRRLAGKAVAEAPLRKSDLPWLLTIILAGGFFGPLWLMFGLARTDAASASLLLNLERHCCRGKEAPPSTGAPC
jgi:hypothetical protein